MGYYGINNYREVSRRTGVGFETIRLIHSGESANPSIRTLYPLARLYRVPMEALVNDAIAVQGILDWIGAPLGADEMEKRTRCPNLRALLATLGRERLTESVTARYRDEDARPKVLAIARDGDILYHGDERRGRGAAAHRRKDESDA
jgi:transcriptional regulator with XRE-family HTH domain